MKVINVTGSSGRLSFTTHPNHHPWWRELAIDNQPVYSLGNMCDTCEAVFELIQKEAVLPLAPGIFASLLHDGVTKLSNDMIDTVTAILPNGRYIASLLSINPSLALPTPSISGYLDSNAIRQKTMLTKTLVLPEIILPIIYEDRLDPARIEHYKNLIKQGKKPTALALSVLDFRVPSGKAITWKLAHFLLDGHHKVMAACQLSQPITMMSFFSLDQSFAPQNEIDQVVNLRYRTGMK